MDGWPLTELSGDDYLFFYATLSVADECPAWASPEWGAHVIGHFELARDAVTGDEYRDLPSEEQAQFASNAHVKRDPFDARVLIRGNADESQLYDTASRCRHRAAAPTRTNWSPNCRPTRGKARGRDDRCGSTRPVRSDCLNWPIATPALSNADAAE